MIDKLNFWQMEQTFSKVIFLILACFQVKLYNYRSLGNSRFGLAECLVLDRKCSCVVKKDGGPCLLRVYQFLST